MSERGYTQMSLIRFLNYRAARALVEVLGLFLHPTLLVFLVAVWLGCCLGTFLILVYMLETPATYENLP